MVESRRRIPKTALKTGEADRLLKLRIWSDIWDNMMAKLYPESYAQFKVMFDEGLKFGV